MKQYIIVDNPQMQQLRQLVEEITHNGVPDDAAVIYKGRNTVYALKRGDDNINIKAFHRPSLFNAFVYTLFRKSKADRSFANASRLIQLGINSPTPIGYGEERDRHRLLRSYYFSNQLASQNMRDWEQKPDCEPLLRAFAQEIVKLHQAGVWHKDFSPGNILYTGNADEGYTFYYIDLNRMKFDVTDRAKLMSMFRAINLSHAETERIARYYAEAAGLNPDETARVALNELDKYLAGKRRKRWLKKLLKALHLR